jgi:type II secretory pathway pseudopilin PulG
MTKKRRPFLFGMRARLHDEGGFSLLETVIAIGIIFGSLLTLALSTTTGLKYFGVGRERQAANQIANQLMEQTRGLAYHKITRGMQTSSLSTDPNLVTSCAGDAVGTYRYLSCAGDKILSTTLNCPTVATDCATPIVPNHGTIGESSEYPLDYSWRTYITNNCPVVSATCTTATPYKVTVVVTWDDVDVGAALAQRVVTQGLFWSPQGCVSSQTHPFAAPCQSFFYGQALAPGGQATVAGTVSGVDFTSGAITLTAAESTLQQEQVSQVQGVWTQTGTQLTTSGGDQFGGATSSSTAAADGDPSGTAPGYAATSSGITGAASNLATAAGTNQMQFTNAAGDTGEAISAVSAGGANVCPPTPPAPPAESDLAPCGGARVLQAGTSQANGHFHGFASDLGSATLVSIANPATATTTFANRMLVSGQNGNLQNTVSRYIGTVRVGGLPANVTGPANWAGYFLQLSSYHDTVVSTAGTSAAAPTATVNAGTLSYWNGTGYTSVNLATTPAYSLSGLVMDRSTTVGANAVRVRIGSSGTISMQTVPTATSTPTGSGSILRNIAQATVGSPVFGTFDYEVWVNGVQVVDLTINLSLGTATSKSIYQPAPSSAA